MRTVLALYGLIVFLVFANGVVPGALAAGVVAGLLTIAFMPEDVWRSRRPKRRQP